MRKFVSYFLICFAAFFNTTPFCLAEQSRNEEMQLRPIEYQSKLYNIEDKKAVVQSIVTTLQEDGFVIQKTSNSPLLIKATKEPSKHKAVKTIANAAVLALSIVVPVFGICNMAREICCLQHKELCGVNANIKIFELDNGLVVRANFQEKYKKWRKITLKDVDDINCYHNFFTQIERDIQGRLVKTSYCQ
jgi:hypothetical protein